jgi:hypothetical protein
VNTHQHTTGLLAPPSTIHTRNPHVAMGSRVSNTHLHTDYWPLNSTPPPHTGNPHGAMGQEYPIQHSPTHRPLASGFHHPPSAQTIRMGSIVSIMVPWIREYKSSWALTYTQTTGLRTPRSPIHTRNPHGAMGSRVSVVADNIAPISRTRLVETFGVSSL